MLLNLPHQIFRIYIIYNVMSVCNSTQCRIIQSNKAIYSPGQYIVEVNDVQFSKKLYKHLNKPNGQKPEHLGDGLSIPCMFSAYTGH